MPGAQSAFRSTLPRGGDRATVLASAGASPPYFLGTLVIDTVFFIIAAFVVEIPELGAFGTLWFLFLMTSAVLLHDWR
ncbi:MAG: hypothetical protein FJW31_16665 [Acidobacteria bacterium]|nr:hypothetical protein [Acidobacteriota bacterium]